MIKVTLTCKKYLYGARSYCVYVINIPDKVLVWLRSYKVLESVASPLRCYASVLAIRQLLANQIFSHYPRCSKPEVAQGYKVNEQEFKCTNFLGDIAICDKKCLGIEQPLNTFSKYEIC